MKKKVSLKIDYFEDYHLLTIVSTLKDYTLSFFLNKLLDFDLKKYGDFRISDDGAAYSWHYYKMGNKYMSCFLIGNNYQTRKLIPALKNFDYLLLLKNVSKEEMVLQMASKIRTIQHVLGVFSQEPGTIKGMDVLIEANELHELEEIISPLKANKTKSKVLR